MHTSKFSLADVLTVLGAAVFGFVCFLSLHFLSLGEYVQSITWAALVTLILGGLAFGIKLLKTTSRKFKTCIIWEWILLLLFAGAATVGVFLFSHYFTVLEKKAEIQNKINANIAQVENMFTEYEKYAKNRKEIYENQLRSIVAAKNIRPTEYEQYGFVSTTDDEVQVENKKFSLNAQLFPNNYEGDSGIKKLATDWLESSRNTLKGKWSFTFGIVKVINKLQTNGSTWNNQLKKFSSYRAPGDTTSDFSYEMTFNDVTDKLTKRCKPTTMAVASAIGLFVVMLFSYFNSKRHSRYPGFKVIFGTGGRKENEI